MHTQLYSVNGCVCVHLAGLVSRWVSAYQVFGIILGRGW